MIKKILRTTFWLALLATFCWTLWFLYSKSQKPPEQFQTQTPFVTNVVKKTVATGSVIPRKEILMKPQVSGIIEQMFVVAGQSIKQGDVIARVKIIPNMVNLNNAESRLNQAKINLDGIKLEYDRNQALFTQGVIPKSDFLQIELRFNTAKEEVSSAQNNLDLIKEGVNKSSGSATNTLVRSTITGMILDVPVKQGNSVIESNTFNEGTTIASVADMGEMIFEGKVDESEVGKIQQGMDLVLTVGAIESERFKAKLEYISPKGLTENGAIQFQIRAAIEMSKNTFLRAGYSANADIILSHKDSVMAVQESWLQFEGEKPFVEVETSPGRFAKRTIKTGISDGINIEIVDGLKKTDKIKIPQAVPMAGPMQ
jgi:HlyD family secretion protein